MLRTRVIPCLLLKDGDLVKGRRFKSHQYVGDPINAVKIFNDKKCGNAQANNYGQNDFRGVKFFYYLLTITLHVQCRLVFAISKNYLRLHQLQ